MNHFLVFSGIVGSNWYQEISVSFLAISHFLVPLSDTSPIFNYNPRKLKSPLKNDGTERLYIYVLPSEKMLVFRNTSQILAKNFPETTKSEAPLSASLMPSPRSNDKKTGSDRHLRREFNGLSGYIDLVGVKFKILLLGVVGLFVCLVGWLFGWFDFFLRRFGWIFLTKKAVRQTAFPRLVGTTNLRAREKNNGSSFTNQLVSSLDLWPPNTKVQVVILKTPTIQTSCTLIKFREIPSKHTMQHFLTSTLNPPLKKWMAFQPATNHPQS